MDIFFIVDAMFASWRMGIAAAPSVERAKPDCSFRKSKSQRKEEANRRRGSKCLNAVVVGECSSYKATRAGRIVVVSLYNYAYICLSKQLAARKL